MVECRGKEVHREPETKDGGRMRWRKQWGEAGSMGDDRRHYRQRGANTHRLKPPPPVWPEEDCSQVGGGQSTKEYGEITVPKA